MIITPMDVAIVMFLSTLAGVLICEAYHLMRLYDEQSIFIFTLSYHVQSGYWASGKRGGIMRLRPYK